MCLGGVGGYLFVSQRCSAGGWRSVRVLLECPIGGACARSARLYTFVDSVFSCFLRCLTRPSMLFVISNEMLC